MHCYAKLDFFVLIGKVRQQSTPYWVFQFWMALEELFHDFLTFWSTFKGKSVVRMCRNDLPLCHLEFTSQPAQKELIWHNSAVIQNQTNFLQLHYCALHKLNWARTQKPLFPSNRSDQQLSRDPTFSFHEILQNWQKWHVKRHYFCRVLKIFHLHTFGSPYMGSNLDILHVKHKTGKISFIPCRLYIYNLFLDNNF